MTKRELSAEQNISPSRISQIMKELALQEGADYTWNTSSKSQPEICFTEIGVEKIRARRKGAGRPFLEVKKERRRKVVEAQGVTEAAKT